MDMLNIYDLNRQKIAVLQNAFRITETHELNKIYSLSFMLPESDEKTKFCQAFYYARYGDGELYRIIQVDKTDSDTGTITVKCEHVIATLVDDLMFGAITYGGGLVKTEDVIRFLLNKQTTKNWILSECDFVRRFEYLWEQENILNALYSVPREFSKAYKWVFDTQSYPWKISLKAIDEEAHPEYYIRAKRNLLSSGTGQDFTNVCTRIYPLGYGEGVNQLTIKDVNNGVPYLQSPAGIVAQYGIKEKVLVDRRFENAETLKEYAQTMLDAMQTPAMSRSFNVVDIYPLTGAEIDNAEVGDICRMTEDGTTAYITKTSRILDNAGDLTLEISTKATDIASNVADLADRVRIETVYAQGATQLYQHSKDANATSSKGMIMSLYFPTEMRQINKVLMKLKLGKFRSYSQTTDAGGGTSVSSEAGGQSTSTSAAGGGSTRTSSSSESTKRSTTSTQATKQTSEAAASTQGTTQQNTVQTTSTDAGGASGNTSTNSSSVSVSGTTATNWEDADYTIHFAVMSGDADGLQGVHSHGVEAWPVIPREAFNHSHQLSISSTGSHSHEFSVPSHRHTISIPSHSHQVTIPAHSHKVTIPGHSHEVTIPAHSHTVEIPSHTHSFTTASHTHTVEIPAHTHNIAAGIFESGNPKSFSIYVSGKLKTTVRATSYEGDITDWLLDPQDHRIPRNSWLDVEIRPDDNAYVQCSVFVQGFVQSRGDQTV